MSRTEPARRVELPVEDSGWVLHRHCSSSFSDSRPARTRRVRPVRSGAALGDSRRGVPSDRLQHGNHALDHRHGGTGRDGVHADRAVGAVLGVVLRLALLPAGRVARLGGRGRAGAIFFLIFRDLAGLEQGNQVYLIGVGTFVLCAGILLFGKRIERTLEILNWVLVVVIIGGFLILAAIFVSPDTWVAAGAGLVGYDPAAESSRFSWEEGCAGRDVPLLRRVRGALVVGWARVGGCPGTRVPFSRVRGIRTPIRRPAPRCRSHRHRASRRRPPRHPALPGPRTRPSWCGAGGGPPRGRR